MAAGWSKLLDVGPLADARAEIDFSIPLSEFPRVLPLLAAPDGSAAGKVEFGREGRTIVAQVKAEADLTLRCQRCLRPMKWPVAAAGRAAVVATPAQADRVPEALETVLAPDHRISIRDLVEEELLLALPLVPRHEDADCGGEEARQATETHRPFGQLGELFRRR
jgi:uncharacterized protein